MGIGIQLAYLGSSGRRKFQQGPAWNWFAFTDIIGLIGATISPSKRGIVGYVIVCITRSSTSLHQITPSSRSSCVRTQQNAACAVLHALRLPVEPDV